MLFVNILCLNAFAVRFPHFVLGVAMTPSCVLMVIGAGGKNREINELPQVGLEPTTLN